MYAANKNKEEYRLGVALPDDSEAEIEYLAIDVTKRDARGLDLSHRKYEHTVS